MDITLLIEYMFTLVTAVCMDFKEESETWHSDLCEVRYTLCYCLEKDFTGFDKQ